MLHKNCIITLRLKAGEPRFTIDYKGQIMQHEPKNFTQSDQLKVLLRILAEDMTTDGLSPEDIAAINEFPFLCNRMGRSSQRSLARSTT